MTGDLAFLDERVLNDWVVGQRWFASKTREVSHIEVVDEVSLAPDLILCLVEARFPVGTHETYQVPLGIEDAAEYRGDATIYEADGRVVYDALRDPAAGRVLLEAMRADLDEGDFSFRWTADTDAPEGPVRPVGVE